MNATTSVTTTGAELFHIRSKEHGWTSWGDVVLVFGPESVQVMAHSEYGTYGYHWTATGADPRLFLCKIGMEYAMEKLSSYGLYEPDPDGYPDEIKRSVIAARRDRQLTREQAREAWGDMLAVLDDYPEGDLMFDRLVAHDLFGRVFGDYDGLPSARRKNTDCVGFWDRVWLPLVAHLEAAIATSTPESMGEPAPNGEIGSDHYHEGAD